MIRAFIKEETTKNLTPKMTVEKQFQWQIVSIFFKNKNLFQSVLIKQGRPKMMFELFGICMEGNLLLFTPDFRGMVVVHTVLLYGFFLTKQLIERMQYLNSYFILNISSKKRRSEKMKQKNSTIKDIERVNYFAHNFSISQNVCLVGKKYRG